MLMQGQFIRVQTVEEGIYEVVFDRENDAINKFDQATLLELKEAVTKLGEVDGLKGVFFSSTKQTFIVGADITEFTQMFSVSEEDVYTHILSLNDIFNAIEDLACPTVVAINGLALGGGFELCLFAYFRVMPQWAQV